MAQTEGQEVSGEQERTSTRHSLAFLQAMSTNTNAPSFNSVARRVRDVYTLLCLYFIDCTQSRYHFQCVFALIYSSESEFIMK